MLVDGGTFDYGASGRFPGFTDPCANFQPNGKPAVVAETDDYVAIASEFRSLAHLPDIGQASLFEPKPEEIYSWRI